MNPIGSGQISLTKHYRLDALVQELAQIKPGMSEADAGNVLSSGGHAHAQLKDDLFIYDHGQIRDDTMLQACRKGDQAAPLLVWAALILADARLAETVEKHLTSPSGKLDPAKFSVDELRKSLATVVSTETGKASSNLLRYFETAGIVEPDKYGGSIVGIGRQLSTAHAVPQLVTYLEERLGALGLQLGPAGHPVDLALAVGANHWLNLSPSEFRNAAQGKTVQPMTPRGSLPPFLQEIHTELGRKRQVILQGPPGVGKTWVARRYIDWATGDNTDAARLTALAASVAEPDRTPAGLADAFQTIGSPALWDIVQFHPSYTYEDFVRGLQAEPVAGGVTFRARNRMLGLIAAVAEELAGRGSDADVILIIDEINRGDISKVFGELIYALEYRDDPVATPYEVDGERTLKLPRRLLLIGTMNTADRSIAVVDYALRRRFVFLDVRPDRAVVQQSPHWKGTSDREAALALFDAVADLFADAEVPELRDLQVGHSYFLLEDSAQSEQAAIETLARRFAYEVYPLLLEYEAEGRYEPEKLAKLLDEVGWSGDDLPAQGVLATKVATRLSSGGQSPQSAGL
jgi:5-methylcytosine-specific restriction enzyme B